MKLNKFNLRLFLIPASILLFAIFISAGSFWYKAKAAELLTNGGAESWSDGMPVGWVTFGNPTTTQESGSNAYAGNYAVKITTNGPQFIGTGATDLSAGENLTWGAAYKGPGASAPPPEPPPEGAPPPGGVEVGIFLLDGPMDTYTKYWNVGTSSWVDKPGEPLGPLYAVSIATNTEYILATSSVVVPSSESIYIYGAAFGPEAYGVFDAFSLTSDEPSNSLPTLSSLTASQTSATIVTATTTISDADSEITSTTVEYSLDGGSTWNDMIFNNVTVSTGTIATTTGAISSIDTNLSSVTITIQWVIPSGTSTSTAQIKITPYDATGAGTATTTANFNISDSNVFRNADFEDWTDGVVDEWHIKDGSGSGITVVSTTDKNSGSYAMRINSEGGDGYVYQMIHGMAGELYDLSFYHKSHSGEGDGGVILLLNGLPGYADEKWSFSTNAWSSITPTTTIGPSDGYSLSLSSDSFSLFSTSSIVFPTSSFVSFVYVLGGPPTNFAIVDSLSFATSTPNSSPTLTAINPIQTSATSVTVTTTISDADSEITSTTIEYSLDGGSTWNNAVLGTVTVSTGAIATTTGAISGIDTDSANVDLSIEWILPSNTETSTAKLKIIPYDATGAGTAVTSDNFTVDNKAPTIADPQTKIEIDEISITTSSITLRALPEPELASDVSFAEHKLYYSTSTGTGMAGILMTSTSDPGWPALGLSNFGGEPPTTTVVTGLAPNTTYYFTLYAFDAWGRYSAYAENSTSTLAIPNSASTVTAISPSQNGANTVIVSTTIADANSDVTSLTVQYSTDNSSWLSATIGSVTASTGTVATSSGSITSIDTNLTGSVDLVFEWSAITDIGALEDTTMYLRIVPNDGSVDGATSTSDAFELDTRSPFASGSLTVNSTTTASVIFLFGIPAEDNNFTEYKIFYKAGASGVTLGDTAFTSSTDVNLGSVTYNSKATTTIPGLSANTQYVANIWAYDSYGRYTAALTEVAFYTLANAPLTPVVTAVSASSVKVVVDQNSNPANTTYAICKTSNGISCDAAGYLQANGSLGESAVWADYATWGGAGGINVTGLSVNTSYRFIVQARNGDNIVTAMSSANTAVYTLAAVPGTPAIGGETRTTLDVNLDPGTNPSGTEFAIQETSSSNYVQADGSLGVSAVWQTDAVWGTKTVTGLTASTTYTFQVMARNGGNVETAFSSTASTATLPPNSAPVATALSPVQSAASVVTVTTTISDANSEVTNLILEYSLNNSTWVSSTLGSVVVSSGAVSTSTGSITSIDTNTGAINLTVQWLVGTDIPDTDDTTVYFRVIPSDGTENGTIVSSSAFTVDTKAPTAPGNLSVISTSTTGVVLMFGSNTADSSFTEYKIFYKAGTSSVTVSDTALTGFSSIDVLNTTTSLSSLSPNTAYVVNVWAYDSWGRSTGAAEITFYTLATTPGTPVVTATGTSTVQAVLITNSNPSNTTYSLCRTVNGTSCLSSSYVQADGTLGASAVWQSYTTWGGASGVAISGLTANTSTQFLVAARNGDSVVTAFSSSNTAVYTLANVPGIPTVNNPSSTTLDVVLNINSNPDSTEFAIQEVGSSNYVQADGSLGASAVWQTNAAWGTVTVTGLTSGNSYQFKAKARNGDSVATVFGTANTAVYTVGINKSETTAAVTEGSAVDTYTLVLTSQPTNDVTISLSAGTGITVSTSSIIFTAANWDTAQTVTTTATNDSVAQGTRTSTITHLVTSADATYNGMTVGIVVVTITDNDTAGITKSETAVAVTEGSTTDTYTLVLTSQPTADVTVTISAGTGVTVSSTSAVFTSANWDTAQTITVLATDDSTYEGTHTASITHSVSSADSNYNGLSVGAVTATITDNDSAPVSSGGSASAPPPAPTYSGSSGSSAVGSAITSQIVGNNATLNFSVNNASYMAISDNPNFTGVSWQTYAPQATISLDNAMEKIVYVKFRSAAGGETEVQTMILKADGSLVSATPPTPSPVSQPVSAPMVTNPSSAIGMTLPKVTEFVAGQKVPFTYGYENDSKKTERLRLVRQLTDAKGKVISTVTGYRTLKPGAEFTNNVVQTLPGNLKPGEYKVVVKILNTLGKVVEDNAFVVEVKAKKIVWGNQPEANAIVFDDGWKKVADGSVLPASLKFGYRYTNLTKSKQVIRMYRELVDSKGKVVSSLTGRWVMVPNETDLAKVSQIIPNTLVEGNYQIRVRATDWSTGKTLVSNSLNFTVLTD